MNDRYIAECIDKVERAICVAIERGRETRETREREKSSALDSIAVSLMRIEKHLAILACNGSVDNRKAGS